MYIHVESSQPVLSHCSPMVMGGAIRYGFCNLRTIIRRYCMVNREYASNRSNLLVPVNAAECVLGESPS